MSTINDCDAKYATAIPSTSDAQELAAHARELLAARLGKALQQCARALKIDLDDYQARLSQLSTALKWSPAIFLADFGLRKAMQTSDVTAICDSLAVLQRALLAEASASIAIGSILEDEWEVPYVAHLRAYEQKNIRGEGTIVRPVLGHKERRFHAQNIEAALGLINVHDDELSGEIDSLITHIKFFQGRVLRGDSSMLSFGAVWLRVPEAEDDQVGYWVEHIVHEVSHLRLAALQLLDPVVLNPAEEKAFAAPIRDDLRPMGGVFHATFVLARMTRIFRRLSLAGFDKRFRDRLQLCVLQLEKGVAVINSPQASLTTVGAAVRESIPECAGQAK